MSSKRPPMGRIRKHADEKVAGSRPAKRSRQSEIGSEIENDLTAIEGTIKRVQEDCISMQRRIHQIRCFIRRSRLGKHLVLCVGDSILDNRCYTKKGHYTMALLVAKYPGLFIDRSCEETTTFDMLSGRFREVPRVYYDEAQKRGCPYESLIMDLYPEEEGIAKVVVSCGGNDFILHPADALGYLSKSSPTRNAFMKRILAVLASYTKKYTIPKSSVYYVKPYYLFPKAAKALLERYVDASEISDPVCVALVENVNALIDEICARVNEQGFTVLDPKWKAEHVLVSKFGIPEPSPAGAKHLAHVISSNVAQG